ncbi:MAG TPA: SAM-dependent methyltransferase [Actinoplanes sp.]
MTRDYVRWHEQYDSPGSGLARRLDVVQRELRRALTDAPHDDDGTRRLISMCAGEGRDVLPVLADHPAGAAVRALLVELDRTLSDRARETAVRLGLSTVTVRTADAGTLDSYGGFVPAHLLLACGVFGNVTVEDAERTIAALPGVLTDDGIVIWTRGQFDEGTDPSLHLRDCFAAAGFTEVSFIRPSDAHFRVGVHRLSSRGRLFTFVR